MEDLSVYAARDIATLDESDWTWFGKMCIEQEWGEKDRQAAIKAVKAIARIVSAYRVKQALVESSIRMDDSTSACLTR